MDKSILLIKTKEMIEFLDTTSHDAQFTVDREVYNGRNLVAKQIKEKHYD